jgi:hypothetical protein
MTIDYGVRRKPGRTGLIIAGAILAVLALAAILAVWANERATRMAVARAWTASGPSCPAASGAPAEGHVPDQIEHYDGVRFARAHGAITCNEIGYDAGRSGDDYPVCQFDHPGRLEVATPAGVSRFDLGPLDPATVTIQHGVTRCVMAISRDVDENPWSRVRTAPGS